MPAPVIYGDGSLYGDTDALYARIHSDLAIAQEANHRETGLRVSVIDERLNLWEHHVGTHRYPQGLGAGLYAPVNGAFRSYEKEFYSFRGGIDMFSPVAGTIVRLRNGDPDNASDRQIWRSVVTDVENLAQWASWSVLYSGTHYGTPKGVVTGVGTYDVYHAKSDGLYINNVKVWNIADDFDSECIGFIPCVDWPGAGWAVGIRRSASDGRRIGDAYWTEDASSGVFVYDPSNYAWFRGALTAVRTETDKVVRIEAHSIHFNPRDGDHGIAMYYNEMVPSTMELTPPYVIRGVGGGSGRNYISGLTLTRMTDGYYYLGAGEVHQDNSLEGATSLGYGLPIWMRSKDLKHWSEPTVGPAINNAWGGTALLEMGDYVYTADNEVVYRRPRVAVEYDVSNYVPEISFNLPRDNQAGTGKMTVANPEGTNDELIRLSDREVIIEPGLKIPDGTYQFAQFDRFFLKQCNPERKGKINRLEVEFGNIWDRLDTDMRDVTNHIGQIDWYDWAPGRRNKAFNYFFVTDTAPVETSDYRLRTRGTCLYTGWKGHNPDVTVSFSGLSGTARVIVRYKDARNYAYFEYTTSGTLTYKTVVNGSTTQIDSWAVAADSTPRIRIQLRWNFYRVWINNTEYGTPATQFQEDPNQPQPGYVGFASSVGSYTISSFILRDFEASTTTEDLIRTALAMGDFHDALIGGATSRIYAVIWGPQTDAQTPAEALQQTLEIDKLQLIWRNGMVEVGKFNDQLSVKTIQNEIIESDEVNEAKRRVNLASVDGNENHWIEVDVEDSLERGRQITGYYDLPELLDLDAVKERAREEIRRGSQGASPGGQTPLFFDLWRMDAINWIDSAGVSRLVRIEGFQVEINQSTKPSQRQTFDLGEFSEGSNDGLIDRTPVVVGNT